jgi:hypothetical protein
MRVDGMACTLYQNQTHAERIEQHQVLNQPAGSEFGARNI